MFSSIHWQVAWFLLAISTTIISTLLFGIKIGRDVTTSRYDLCKTGGESCRNDHRSVWDFEHVPNPAPVYQPMVFKEISDARAFKSPEDAVNDTTWKEIITPGGGFLHVQNSEGEVVGYGVSMYHQLHCLNMMRQMLLGQPMTASHETDDWSEDNMHWLHCLDYLAQGVLCAADDTLEKPGFTRNFKGKMVEGIDGMGHTHQCRNASRVREAVLQSEGIPRPSKLLGPDTLFKVPGRDGSGHAWVVSEE